MTPPRRSLFAQDAWIHPPLYGRLRPSEFYPQLFDDTSNADLTLKSVMEGLDEQGSRTMAFWFRFDWTLSTGQKAPFTVVDVAVLDDELNFRELHIIYDTVDVRPIFEEATRRP